MKYLYVVVAVVIVIGGYFLFRTPSAPRAPVELEPVAVSMIKRTVYLDGASTTRKEVIDPVEAFEGDEVETLNFGRALVQFQNGTLTTIDYSTKLTIQSHEDDEHTSMKLQSGKVWSTVKKVFGKGEYYEIETQNAVAVVRGTSFGVSFDGTNTILEVTEGSVLLVSIDPKTGERLYDKAVLVPAGKKAVIGPDGLIKVSDLAEGDKTREWYIFNNGNLTAGQQNQAAATTTDVHVTDLQIKAR